MHWRTVALTGISACTAVVVVFPTCIPIFLLLLLTLLTVLLGAVTVFGGHLMLSSPHKTTVGAENSFKSISQFRDSLMNGYDNSSSKSNQSNLPPIFGKTVDSLLKQVIDFVVRDYINWYLKKYAYESDCLCENIKEDIWGALQLLHERLARVDRAKLIACDFVIKITNHFEKIRVAQIVSFETGHPPLFSLSPHVLSDENELQFLRSFSEILIMFFLPRSYSLSPTKYFVREILVCKLFKPTIDMLTDPDFINRNIVIYIETHKISNVHVKAFEYAKSFEDFLKIIEKTNDIEALTSIRYNIVNKLMQATTLQNLNRAKGVDLDNEKSSLAQSGVHKSDIYAAKKLKKYIAQLTYAKKECEKRLANLGWDFGYQYDESKKFIPLKTVLEHVLGRKYLTQFLETLASQDLVRFWCAVEELRMAHRKNWHQLGAEIFYTFIRNPTSEIKVEKNTKRRMEAFLLGDKGPEVFYEVQAQVVQTVEDKYYQPFLISDYYKEMVLAMEKEDGCEVDSVHSIDEQNATDSGSAENSLNVGDHSNYARRKLDQLQEKYNNKFQALQALRQSLRPESKVLSILEKEVEWLQGEQRQLEAHLTRTEIWGENLGKWRANVQSAEVPDEKESPQFVIVVHMMENDTEQEDESISTGWVVCRSLTQFQELHRKLRPLCSDIRSLELPSNTFKFLFGKTDRTSLEKAKNQIQKYLDFVLQDDRLNQSEAIYSFLSPSSEHLKHSTPSPKKSRFSLSTLFKSEQSKDSSSSLLKESQEENLTLDALGSNDTVDFNRPNGHKGIEDPKDTIAEPLYSLLSEIFDMRGVFKYLRKTLIGFVQVTYGRNINRQIHETIAWWFSEQMLHYYITLFLKSFWPGGTLAGKPPDRTREEKRETAKKARELFVNNVPELLTTLVGNTASKNGAMKIFNILQEKNMNKQLFYEIFETTLDAVFPELR